MFDALRSLTDPSDPVFSKYMKDALGGTRLKALDDAPGLRALVETVGELPGMKKWLETRPKNEEEQF